MPADPSASVADALELAQDSEHIQRCVADARYCMRRNLQCAQHVKATNAPQVRMRAQ